MTKISVLQCNHFLVKIKIYFLFYQREQRYIFNPFKTIVIIPIFVRETLKLNRNTLFRICCSHHHIC